MTKKPLALSIMLALCATTAAQAQDSTTAGDPIANLSEPQGRVLVNQGEEYVIGRTGMSLYSGDRIVTMDSSTVSVAYSNGCSVDLPENSQLTLTKPDECQQAAAAVAADSGAIGAEAPIPEAASAAALEPAVTFPFSPSFVAPYGVQDVFFYVTVLCASLETFANDDDDCTPYDNDNDILASPE